MRLAAVARRPALRDSELAWGASIAAEWTHYVALGIFAYRVGGTTAVGIAGLVRLLPAAVVAPFAAALADRYRRERFLLCVSLVGAVALAASAAAVWAHATAVVFAAAAVVGITSTLFRPALQALLPALAQTPDELIAANGATSTLEGVGTLVGPAAAAGALALSGLGTIFAGGAVALLAAAALLARVSVEGREPRRYVTDVSVRTGLRTLRDVPAARTLVAMMVVQTFVRGCLNVLVVVAAFEVLDAGSSAVGYLTAAVGAGALAGALAASALDAGRLVPTFALSLVLWGAPIAALGFSTHLLLAVASAAVIGAANSVEDVAGFTLLQRVVPNEVLTALLGVFWGLAMGSAALGSTVTPLVLHLAGNDATFLVVSALLPALVLLARRSLRRIEGAVPPGAHLAAVENVPMLARLSLAAKERLARALTPVSVGPGQVVIERGAVGDRFYIVADGAFTAETGDGVVRDAGAFFGEIALLRDIPRTATVRARGAARLYALQRDDFLVALTGHRGATETAAAVADARLASV